MSVKAPTGSWPAPTVDALAAHVCDNLGSGPLWDGLSEHQRSIWRREARRILDVIENTRQTA